MSEQKFRYRKESEFEIAPSVPISYEPCADGIRITAGTLPGNGFSFGRGITVPEEIDGVPVTEVDVSATEAEFVDGPALKRVRLRLRNHFREEECQFGRLYGPVQQLFIESKSKIRLTTLYSNTLELLSVSAPEIYFSGDFSEDKFSSCPELQSVSFGGTVLANRDWESSVFPANLFRGCEKLRSVSGRFSGDCTHSGTFRNCVSLIEAPTIAVKRMGDSDFENCRSLRTVHLSNGMKEMGARCFAGCASLEDVYIPDTVTALGWGILAGCSSLRSVHLPDALTEIPAMTFRNCAALQKCFLSDRIETIGSEAFAGCSSLRNPWIPKNLKKIGDKAFAGCRSMTQVMIPESVTEIGEQAFADCPSLLIKGGRGSAAEAYAWQNGIRFEARF